MKVKEFYNTVRGIFPAVDEYDHDGIALDCGNDIKKVMTALDVTSDVIQSAVESKCDLIATHHPLIFDPLDSVGYMDPTGKRLIKCIKNDISLVSFHLCLDAYDGGVNDCLCSVLGITGTTAYLPFARVGCLAKPESINEFAARVESSLGCKPEHVADTGRPVHRVAVLGGSGKSYIKEGFETGADTYLTGELNHSALIECREYGMNVVCGTHFGTENVVIPTLSRIINDLFPETEVMAYGV